MNLNFYHILDFDESFKLYDFYVNRRFYSNDKQVFVKISFSKTHLDFESSLPAKRPRIGYTLHMVSM